MAKRPVQLRARFNMKRRIEECPDSSVLAGLARKVKYRGSPLHKRDPGDFQLTPPAQPRNDKTLCDGVRIHTREVAQGLLREGVRRGLISVQTRGQFPQNIWAVTESGCPLEAQWRIRIRAPIMVILCPRPIPSGMQLSRDGGVLELGISNRLRMAPLRIRQ